MRHLHPLAVAAALSLLVALPATAQDPLPAPPGSVVDVPADSQRTPQAARRAGRLTLELGVTGLYDSNIGHDEAELSAVGNVTGIAGEYVNRLGRLAYALNAGLAAHSYTQTDRYDRISKLVGAGLELPIAGPFSAGFETELSLGGANEDRVLTDQLTLSPRLYARFGRGGLARLYGAHRLRESDSGEESTNQYLGAAVRTASGNRPYLELSTRFEQNDAETEENDFDRQTHSVGGWIPVARSARLGARLQYTRQDYVNRLLDEDEVPDPTVPHRRDEKWTPRLALRWDVLRPLRLEAVYEFESRTSSDPDKDYQAHIFELGTRYRW